MLNRNLLLLAALGLSALAWAKPPPGKAKSGESCKSADDCDQSDGPKACVDSKCAESRPRPTPPPTTATTNGKKTGERCQADNECDQSEGRQVCYENRCAPKKVPPPVT